MWVEWQMAGIRTKPRILRVMTPAVWSCPTIPAGWWWPHTLLLLTENIELEIFARHWGPTTKHREQGLLFKHMGVYFIILELFWGIQLLIRKYTENAAKIQDFANHYILLWPAAHCFHVSLLTNDLFCWRGRRLERWWGLLLPNQIVELKVKVRRTFF